MEDVLVKETDTTDVSQRNAMLVALEKAGTKGVVMISEYDVTYSMKMIRTPESKLPAMGVSTETGEALLKMVGQEARMVIRAKQTAPGRTSNVFGEKGPKGAMRILVGAHHEGTPGSPSAFDNASGIGIVLEMAKRFATEDVKVRLGFVGWGGHEFGAYGSCMYVKNYPEEAKRVKRLLIFDGMGVKGANPEVVVSGGEALMASVKRATTGMEDVLVKKSTHRPGAMRCALRRSGWSRFGRRIRCGRAGSTGDARTRAGSRRRLSTRRSTTCGSRTGRCWRSRWRSECGW